MKWGVLGGKRRLTSAGTRALQPGLLCGLNTVHLCPSAESLENHKFVVWRCTLVIKLRLRYLL